jgi:hypothetical protein
MNKLLYISFLLLLAGITFAQDKEILLNWECNMELEIAASRFDPATDTVAARGGFNSWARFNLIADPGDPNYYISENPFVDTLDLGDTIKYKFFYTPDVWEAGGDRLYVITQDDYNAGEALISRPFNDATLSTVTLTDSTVITFSVDVSNAKGYNSGQPFPAITDVILAGGISPLQWPGGSWPLYDSSKVFRLEDQGGGIWSVDVVFQKFTVFDISYKYGINYFDSTNIPVGDTRDNEAGVGDNHMISLSSYLWAAEVQDTFGVMGFRDFTTDVNEIPGSTPSAYALEQNFPNPFNPGTTINFSIPTEGFVTLDVYNSIGQKVASLVNETKTAGSYTVGFDATNLTSGIYFYRISSGSFSETKKMILLK